MSMWTVALGVVIGIVGGVLLLACALVVFGVVSGLRRVPCRVCGLRASRVDMIVHEELEHHRA